MASFKIGNQFGDTPNPEYRPAGFDFKMMLIGLYVKTLKAHPQCICLQKVNNITIRRIHCKDGQIIETTIKD